VGAETGTVTKQPPACTLTGTPKRTAHRRAKARAEAGRANETTATAPEKERDDGRKTTETSEPARKAEKARERGEKDMEKRVKRRSPYKGLNDVKNRAKKMKTNYLTH